MSAIRGRKEGISGAKTGEYRQLSAARGHNVGIKGAMGGRTSFQACDHVNNNDAYEMTDSKDTSGEFPRFTITAASPSRTKAGRLRALFDEIEAAQAQGWRLDGIIRGLAEQHLHVTLETLKSAMKRMRAERRKRAGVAESQNAPKNQRAPTSAAKSENPKSESAAKPKDTFSPEGYRNPLPTFTRDIHRRINLDE